MFQKQSLFQACMHLAAFMIGYAIGYFLFGKASYGLLTAWWLSLYIGFLARISARAIPPIIVTIVAALVSDVFLDLGWFYLEGPSVNPFTYFAISLTYSLVLIVSPIFFNTVARYFFARGS